MCDIFCRFELFKILSENGRTLTEFEEEAGLLMNDENLRSMGTVPCFPHLQRETTYVIFCLLP